MNRRKFLQNTGRVAVAGTASAAGLSVLGLSLKPRARTRINPEDPPVLRPPGAQAERQFLAQCLRCTRCQDACPVGCIRLAGPGEDAPVGTPYINASSSACILCLDCTHSCPTEALQPLQEKKTVKMGVAIVDERTCVSHNGTGVCGACHTVCPFRNVAIKQGLRNAPKVEAEHCVGCGLCEEACILKGTKAIRVFSERSQA